MFQFKTSKKYFNNNRLSIVSQKRLAVFFAHVALLVFTLVSAEAFAQAEIQVRSFSPPVNITSGDTTPDTADRTDFGVFVPGRTADGTFIISNSGDETLNFTSNPLTITGVNAERFIIQNNRLDDTLEPGDTAQFGVRYEPLESPNEQISNAIVNISSNDSDENPFTFAIRATTSAPTGPPQTSIRNRTGSQPIIPNGDTNPSTAKGTDFGDVLLNAISRNPNDIQIVNLGGDVLKLPSEPVSVSGPHASDFRVDVSNTSAIPPGISRSIDISFVPSGVGLRTATISLETDDTDNSPYTFQVQGMGVAPPPVETLTIVSGNNQTADTGELYDRLTVLAVDSNNDPIPGLTITLSSPTSGASLTNTSIQRTTLSNGTALFLSLRANTIAGAFKARATIDDKEVEFNLENTVPVVTPREINVTSNSSFRFEAGNVYNIGVLPVGQSTFDAWRIQNEGTEVLTLGPNSVSITGANASEFRISRQPNETVPGRSITAFTLYYEPTSAGVKTATLTINNDDADESPLVFTLRVESLAATSPPEIVVRNSNNIISNGDTSPSTVDRTDFATELLSASKTQEDFSIFNPGGDVLRITESSTLFTGPNAADFSFVSSSSGLSWPLTAIPPNLRHDFSIVFQPTGLGIRTATLALVSNDADESPYTFQVSGIGTANLVASSGGDQNSAISRPFSQALTVLAEDSRQQPVSGAIVNFIAPSSGAGGTLSRASAVTNADGLASIVVTANSIIGSYTVSASMLGSNEVSFNLNNLPDRDADGIADLNDNCADKANTDQSDVDQDSLGDACDEDADNDTINNDNDNCPLVPNIDQSDGRPSTPEGDVCELAETELLCFPIKANNQKVAVVCF